MKHDGRGVIRINDRTDHDGQVIDASSGTVVMGLQAALEGDMTYCPRCKGKFAIKTDEAGAKHNGKHYAYHGDVTECGARLLTSVSFSGGAAAVQSTSPTNAANASTMPAASSEASIVGRQFDDRFILLDDETGKPLAHKEYAIRRASGQVEFGISDAQGVTHLLSSLLDAEAIELYACTL